MGPPTETVIIYKTGYCGFLFPNRKTYKFTNKPPVLPVTGSKLTVKFRHVKWILLDMIYPIQLNQRKMNLMGCEISVSVNSNRL